MGYWEGVVEFAVRWVWVVPIVAYLAVSLKRGPERKALRSRGKKLLSYQEACRKSRLFKPEPDEGGLTFGGITLPRDAGRMHFAITGVTGSGKTLTIRLLMQSVFSPEAENVNALVYDAKRDMLPLLSGMDIDPLRVKVLNPFDARSVSWDIASDIQTPASAWQAAHLLIPERNEPQSYFADTARRLLAGSITSRMITKPDAWSLKDIVLDCSDAERLRSVLSRVGETKLLLSEFDTGLTFKSVMSTLATRIKPFEIIAALWDHAGESISLSDWMESDQVLVLGSDESVRSSMNAVNQLIFQRVSELLLSQEDNDARESWLILDEIKEAGRLSGLPRLLTQGRSKGVCCVLGFQDIEGMHAVWGREQANELIGQCSNKAVLRIESPSTAEWAAKLFGYHEAEEKRTSVSESNRSQGKSESLASVRVDNVLPSEFFDIETVRQGRGLTGYYHTPLIGGYRHTYGQRDLFSKLGRKADAPGFMPRDCSQQKIRVDEKKPQASKVSSYFST